MVILSGTTGAFISGAGWVTVGCPLLRCDLPLDCLMADSRVFLS